MYARRFYPRCSANMARTPLEKDRALDIQASKENLSRLEKWE